MVGKCGSSRSLAKVADYTSIFTQNAVRTDRYSMEGYIKFNEWVKKKDMTHAELEKKEEETGIDYDHDSEKGESEEHKKKVLAAKKKREG